MKPETIKDLRKLEKKATPPDWDTDNRRVTFSGDWEGSGFQAYTPQDARLIAAMRNNITDLLDLAEYALQIDRIQEIERKWSERDTTGN